MAGDAVAEERRHEEAAPKRLRLGLIVLDDEIHHPWYAKLSLNI